MFSLIKKLKRSFTAGKFSCHLNTKNAHAFSSGCAALVNETNHYVAVCASRLDGNGDAEIGSILYAPPNIHGKFWPVKFEIRCINL